MYTLVYKTFLKVYGYINYKNFYKIGRYFRKHKFATFYVSFRSNE